MLTTSAWRLFKQTFLSWLGHNAPRLGAALAFYTILSLAPLLIIVIAIAGAFFGEHAVEGRIVEQAQGLIGDEGAQALQAMIRSAGDRDAGVLATALGIAVLLFGASAVFRELRASLNTMFDVRPAAGGIVRILRTHLFSFGMVVTAGFLLLVSLVVSTAITVAGERLGALLGTPAAALQALNVVASLAIITAIFAMVFKFVPDVRLHWGDVWIGATITALLFLAGQILIGLYLGKASIGSAYGAAGSLVIVLVWVYYSAQIFLFGAEFTQVYAKAHGSHKRQEPEQASGPKDA